jgi:pyruvate dehydrogenase E2 component (dihydrolipoamide acetyltransferase)
LPEVTMPRLSDSMEEGTILRWLKSDGDEVKNGEEIAEIETDKATMTFEADADGTLHIVAEEGSTLPIGELIATIGEEAPAKGSDDGDGGGGEEAKASDEGDDADAKGDEAEDGDDADDTDQDEDNDRSGGGDEAAAQSGGEEQAQAQGEGDDGAEAKGEGDRSEAKAEGPSNGASADGERVKASPVARRLAKEQGVELSAVEGTGPGGRIVKADVEKAAESGSAKAETKPDGTPAGAAKGKDRGQQSEEEPSPAAAASAESPGKSDPKVAEKGTAKGDVAIEELTRTQQVVARRMAEAKATIPEFTLQTEIDMERCVQLRNELKALAGEGDVVPSYNDMVVKACGMALRDFPRANGAYKDNKFEIYSRVNVGVAVAAQNSLVVPTIHDADAKSLGEIARTIKKLAARVRDGTISPPDLSGGTFTVSNLGMYGVTNFTAVINPPQAAILAVGSMEKKPVVVDDEVKIHHRMGVTLACDHRILYGADAAQFLARVRELLEEPLRLAL